MSGLPASMSVHGVFEILVLVVVDSLLALPLLRLYPIGSCTQTHSDQALCNQQLSPQWRIYGLGLWTSPMNFDLSSKSST